MAIKKTAKKSVTEIEVQNKAVKVLVNKLQKVVVKSTIPVCTGAKYDNGKAEMDLIDPDFEMAMAMVLTGGAKVHGAYSWKTIQEPIRRYTAALQRHTNAMRKGEVYDSATNLTHAAHIAVNAMFLHYFQTK